MSLLKLTSKGIYCEIADVYLDPIEKVDKAIISHGHGDHLKAGCKNYLCTTSALPVIRYRMSGYSASFSSLDYHKELNINGVKFSFYPAGHIIGSAQIRVEYQGEVWNYTGDFKIENDYLAETYEPVKCHTLITESTFGLPIFKWKPQKIVYQEINEWWYNNHKNGITSVIAAYALGKAQRLIHALDSSIAPIICHATVQQTNQIIREQGIILPTTHSFNKLSTKDFTKGALVIAPPPICEGNWLNKFAPYQLASVSGWNTLSTRRINKKYDQTFILSDHADWNDLLLNVKDSGAEQVITTHGYVDQFSNYLNRQSISSKALEI